MSKKGRYKGVVGVYVAIENGVVNGYKAVESATVESYKSVEDAALRMGRCLAEEYHRLKDESRTDEDDK